MDAHSALELLATYDGVDLNEADTRHQIIDVILHELLHWPRSRTKCEKHVNDGYADYVLHDRSGSAVIVIEAKRTGISFTLPVDSNSTRLSRFVALSSLLTDPTISATVEQARGYAIDLGCEFAAVTNGRQWIFFRAFAKGKNWKLLRAFVIQSNAWFSAEYTQASNYFSFTAIDEQRSLSTLLVTSTLSNREIYYSKERIENFTAPVNSNKFEKYLRPTASRYFRNLEDANEEDFFASCYVRQREYDSAFGGLSEILRDALTPYLERYGIQQTDDTERGGRIGNRIIKSLRDSKSADVVVLFGGKGIGKSTFLRRLLVQNAPQFLSKHAVVARIDLLNIPDDPSAIRTHIWTRLVDELDVDKLLNADRENLLELFSDRYETATRQTLVGLPPDSIEFNTTLNTLIGEWKRDLEYCATRLSEYWRKNHRGIIVVVDNTDQFKGETQDHCFTLAQQLATHLSCLSLISMREERFQKSRVHGVLDAFQNSGYHLSAPLPHQVFLTRLEYVTDILQSKERVNQSLSALNYESQERDDLIRFFDILKNEFKKGASSPLFTFLVACAHGNIRLALELFRGFLVSGYTNIGEMVNVKANLWTLKIHQVVRPLMTPHRFFYEEADSQIPNLYQIRSKSKGSHFTALRILKRLSKGADPNNPHFVSIADLRDIFVSTYDLLDEMTESLDVLLRYALIEANNRIDEYSDDIDEVRITQYGIYLLTEIAQEFTYLDLTSTDCGVYSQTTASELAHYGNEDYRLFRANQKMERVTARIAKVRCFLEYLSQQEVWERENLGIVGDDLIVSSIREGFELSVPDIERSAVRNVGRA